MMRTRSCNRDVSMQQFSLAEWKGRLSMRWEEALTHACAGAVCPRMVVALETVRQTIAKCASIGRSVPTDVFVLGRGEPADPYCTKVGGLPARPRDLDWPYTDEEVPFLFVEG